jgi:iron complex outermembrane recepter protein
MNTDHRLRTAISLMRASFAFLALMAFALSAWPQDASPQKAPQDSEAQAGTLAEVIVTARKRNETELSVPVTLNAVSGADLERQAIVSLDDLNAVVPQFMFGENPISVQGGAVTLRGISSGDTNTTADQAVSFDIDGAQIARSTVRRMALMDISEIDVLKGPQTLFFGKNSPGGIVSIRTADPTPTTDASFSIGEEFVGEETRGEGHLSGPITDTLGYRVALYGSYLNGWTTNTLPPGPQAPLRDHTPYDREGAGRLTLKFEPADDFDARLKFNYGHLRTDGIGGNSQYVYCPLGKPQLGDVDDCEAGNRTSHATSGPNFSLLDSNLDGGEYLIQSQILTSLEMNYKITKSLVLTSMTSLYNDELNSSGNANQSAYLVYLDHSRLSINELTEELRLNSDFSSWFNFTAGGLVQRSNFQDHPADGLYANDPYLLDDFDMHMPGRSDSVFGQLRFNVLNNLELAGGGRYSHETKDFEWFGEGVSAPPYQSESFNDFSPEATVTYRPTTKLTLYGSYKQGFLSGGYNVLGVPYEPETTKGFEGGVKTLLLDDTLRANVAAYTYETTGLQVSLINGAIVSTVNAGKSRIGGAEADLQWQTPLRGLELTGATGYNHARYDVFNISCYSGQTTAEGCDLASSAGAYTLQNLAGHPLEHAPAWTGNAGAMYEFSPYPGLRMDVSGDAAYTSSYYTIATEDPGADIGSYVLLNANAKLFNASDTWAVELIGKNLGNKYYYISTSEVYGTGKGTGTAGPALPADLFAYVSRGREVWLRLTYKFR